MDPSYHGEAVGEYDGTGQYLVHYYQGVVVNGGPMAMYSGSPHGMYGGMYYTHHPTGYMLEQGLSDGSSSCGGQMYAAWGHGGGKSRKMYVSSVDGRGKRYVPGIASSGKSVGSRSTSSPRSSASVSEVRQQSKTDKSAIASMIGLCISDEEFRVREKEFQIPMYASVSMEAAHQEYLSSGKCVLCSGDIEAVSKTDISEMDPDVVRRVAFDHEGSKALQKLILSHGNLPSRARTREPKGGGKPLPQGEATPPTELKGDTVAIDRIYTALSKDIVNLCLDMYGNYTVQCLLMEASPHVASHLGDVIVSNVVPFSLNFYGCRVVQCAIRHLSMEYRQKMCDAIEPFALQFLQSQNANHVIETLLRLPRQDRPAHVERIHASMCHYAVVLATHKYGVTVLKTALESGISRNVSNAATRRLLGILSELAHDEYGNYIVQSLIQADLCGARRAVHEFLLQFPLLTLACDKFASNVFETSLLKSTPEQSDAVILEFLEQCGATGDNDHIIVNIAMNKYANYVVQRMLGTSSPRVRQILSRHLAPSRALLMESKYGRRIAKQVLFNM